MIIGLIILLYNKCEWFRNGVNALFGGIADFIKGVINKIKGFFNFEWKLPKIKLPHFKVSGSWSLVPPKVPKFSVDWYANGGILNSPTIFGMNGDRMMGGGEAGAEAVLPIDLLKTYIRDEMQSNNAVLAQLITEALSELTFVIENNISLGDRKLADVLVDAIIKKMSSSGIKRGDILLNTASHTAMSIGNGQVVQASQNELGGATGGQTGDQTGREIWCTNYYNFPWNYVLRLSHSESDGSSGGTSAYIVKWIPG